MSKPLRADEGGVPNTCGLGWVGNFSRDDGHWSSPDHLIQDVPVGKGTGFFVAGFIDTEDCKEAYEYLTSHYTSIFQSPVRYNQNSGNNFFFCLFDK